ncbi:GTP-binding protein TypA [Elusimicrobium minutum Pei191]|uniref:Large ribosomal subunit assembly factor BipA n=1 Tax=Elusimicrobium minutum (strain Pei191) TaxID=445932 RepID=B2KC01_ELUMP|nr:translational GTPase TypA [Elusimicrobium minutum]ACC98128.1 GTP-binding protein TypA [Elusimicrobium minutum Pei191]
MNHREDVRNIAIIAHVDHGKTTIVDSMLKITGEFNIKEDAAQDTVLDSNPLERERGITILAKCTSVPYKNHIINIVDTPGHADFGSEVERVLKMVDGAILMVDAVDGPMPQTRFVLRKALSLGIRPIVVINKMDRLNADPHRVVDDVFNLFIELGATDEQLDFPILYASGKEGWASENAAIRGTDITPLFESILKQVPPPIAHLDKPLQMQITMLDYSNFLGSIGTGRIYSGNISKGQTVILVKPNGETKNVKALKIERFLGLIRQEVQSAEAGDIVSIAGLEGVNVGDTVCQPEAPLPMPALSFDEPTISMEFFVNDSPFAGREGKFLTSRHIKARLEKEAHTNVGLIVEQMEGEGKFKVSGRGELHLTILIETMRREGFELAVSSPQVIYKEENGVVTEPFEYLILDIPSEFQGVVFEMLGTRGAKLENMVSEGENRLRLEYSVASRALLGFKNEFLTSTRGKGIMHHSFHGYYPKQNLSPLRRNGVFIAKEPGETTVYAIFALSDGGQFFVGPGEKVYAGMIVGQNSRENDLVVNPNKAKKLSNMRSKATDEAYTLSPKREFTLEQAIEYIAPDELVEITPVAIRMRKKILDFNERKRFEKTDTVEVEA